MYNLDKSENWRNWEEWEIIKRSWYGSNNVLDHNLNKDHIMAIAYGNMSIILF